MSNPLGLTFEQRQDLAVWAEKKRGEMQQLQTDVAHQRELKQCRKALKGLSDSILVYLHKLDIVMKEPSTVEHGKRIALLTNQLDEANDHIRYFTLGVDHRKDDKEKAVARLLKR